MLYSKKLLFLLSFLFAFSFANAQLLPPNQPEQDACNALKICGDVFYSPYGYQGIGQVSDLTGTPCGGGEGNSLWLRLEVNTPGSIVFTIAPEVITDDYDMAVIDITNSDCSSFNQSHVIRCNFNNNMPTFNNGITGLNMTSNLHFVVGGTTGSSYLEYIDANAGDVYLIMINNFGTGFNGPVSGFTIDFTGSTATFNQNPAPKFLNVVNHCDYSQEIKIKLSEYVLCSSIAADGSDFSLWPSGTITSAVGTNCTGPAGYTDEITITFNGTLPNGNYKLMAEVGTDGNTLLGICSEELQQPDSLLFTVGQDPIEIVSLGDPACQFIEVNLSSPVLCNSIAVNGSDFIVEGPSNVTVASAQAINCVAGMTSKVLVNLANPIMVDGTYTLKVKTGTDGNTLIDDCNRLVPVDRSINFIINSYNVLLTAKPDTTICNTAESIQLYGINNAPTPAGGFQYQWEPSDRVSNPNALNTNASIQMGQSNVFHLQTVDANGCVLRDSNVVNISYLTGHLDPKEPIICDGDSILLSADGGTIYQWSSNANMSGGTENISCPNCRETYVTGPIGEHNYYVVVKDEFGCSDTLVSHVTVKPKPDLDVQPRDTTIYYGDKVQLHASGATFYNWYPIEYLDFYNLASPVAFPKETTLYTVHGIDRHGCIGIDSSLVEVIYRDAIRIPNSFTPNGDGLNDKFKIINIEPYHKIQTFHIYNRYGQLVFETMNPEEGWDGKLNGKNAELGVYMYHIQIAMPNGEIRTYNGDITLLR